MVQRDLFLQVVNLLTLSPFVLAHPNVKNMIAIAKQTTTELAEIETQISHCIRTAKREWEKVGMLLQQIRKRRLYKPFSFNKWLRTHKDWRISRQRADQLIRGAKAQLRMIGNNCCRIPNEGTARELLHFPENKQVSVWKNLTKNGKVPTAKEIRQVHANLVKPNKEARAVKSASLRIDVDLAEINAEAFDTVNDIMGGTAKTNAATTKLYMTETPERIGKILGNIANILHTLPIQSVKVVAQ